MFFINRLISFFSFDDHPQTLKIIFWAELGERFSFFSTRALLILYMTTELNYQDSYAYGIIGMFFALINASNIVGGYVADKFIGNRQAIYLGGIFIAIGDICLLLPLENNLTLSLSFLVIGTGFFKVNMVSLLGQIYKNNEAKRDAGFVILYTAINLGAFLACIICGYLGIHYGWKYGFASAGLGIITSIIILYKNEEKFGEIGYKPQYILKQYSFFKISSSNLTILGMLISIPILKILIDYHVTSKYFLNIFCLSMVVYLLFISFTCQVQERKAILTILSLLPVLTVFWASFEQVSGTIHLFIDRYVDKNVAGFIIPTPWFMALGPLLIIFMAPLFSALWQYLDRYDLNPSVQKKFIIALVQESISYVFLWLSLQEFLYHQKISLIWILLASFFRTNGEICLAPVGMSLFTKLSPARFSSFMIGFFFLSISFAQIAAQQIAKHFTMTYEEEFINQDLTIASINSNLNVFNNLFCFLIILTLGTALFTICCLPLWKKYSSLSDK